MSVNKACNPKLFQLPKKLCLKVKFQNLFGRNVFSKHFMKLMIHFIFHKFFSFEIIWPVPWLKLANTNSLGSSIFSLVKPGFIRFKIPWLITWPDIKYFFLISKSKILKEWIFLKAFLVLFYVVVAGRNDVLFSLCSVPGTGWRIDFKSIIQTT